MKFTFVLVSGTFHLPIHKYVPGKCQKKTSIVDVTDVTRLIFQIVIEKQKGIFNVTSDDSLTIYDWTTIISKKLQKKNLKIICIPFFLVNLLSILSCYRLLAQEQLLMLKHDHILSNHKNAKSHEIVHTFYYQRFYNHVITCFYFV